MTRGPQLGARLAVIALTTMAFGLRASPTDTVAGNLDSTAKDGGGHFTCTGTPTCTGIATVTTVHNNNGCTNNTFTFSSNITFTALDLSHAGTVSGTFTIAQVQSGQTQLPNGSCSYILVPGSTWPYTGTWDGKLGSLTIASIDTNGVPNPFSGTFTANLSTPAPVFPMTVTSNVTTTTATANATIQPRAQDVGSTASVYVFAHAPSNLVIGASPAKRSPPGPAISAKTDDTIVCVLAQVNSSGQLVAVSASTMQAYLSGVLGAQMQAVEVLRNAPVANVGGATMFVGYGSSAAAMLSSGLYETAITVAGGVQCTASLDSAPAPETPGAITGLWWNPSESGWGIHFTQRGSNVFAAWYTYDASGKPKWYVAPNCAGASGTSGACNGSLYEVNGPTFFGVNFVPIGSNQVSTAGSLKVAFTDANNGSMTYTVGSNTRTVPIVRQPVGVGTLTPAVDYSDLWWNPNESGWGMAMAQQNANIFLAWYVYDNTGKPVWYVASNCTVNGSSCAGTLYSTTGPPFGNGFDPHQVQVTTAGSVIVSFIDANNAVLSYTVGSVTATKTITRQLF
jgi:hypothetical protein